MRELLEVLFTGLNGIIEGIATILGLQKGAAIAAFISAIISLRFVPEMVSWKQKLWMVGSGFFCAVFVAPGISEIMGFQQKTQYAIIFGVGVLGLSIAAAIQKVIVSGELWSIVKERLLARRMRQDELAANPLENPTAEK